MTAPVQTTGAVVSYPGRYGSEAEKFGADAAGGTEEFNDVCAGALALVAVGLYVFPVQGRTATDERGFKAPVPGLRWREESSTDPERVIAWFGDRADLGVAVDCGKSRLVVVDIDQAGILPEEWLTPDTNEHHQPGEMPALVRDAARGHVWQQHRRPSSGVRRHQSGRGLRSCSSVTASERASVHL